MGWCAGDAKINLVVLPATADIAAAEGLKIAKKLDPKGERTLGVVTKVDMQPSNLHKKLDGTDETVPKLQLGYVGVSPCPASFADQALSNSCACKAQLCTRLVLLKHDSMQRCMRDKISQCILSRAF